MEPLEPTDHRPLTSMRKRRHGATQSSSGAGDAITRTGARCPSMIAQAVPTSGLLGALEISPETVKSHRQAYLLRSSTSRRAARRIPVRVARATL